MSIVILDAMENENSLSDAITSIFRDGSEEISHFKLKNMQIQPCRSCEACSFKSPGKCVVKDDMHEILYKLAKCTTIVMLTPVSFGGYSSCLKKAMDKIALLCMPSYTVKYGHLLHPARYGEKTLFGIGVYAGDPKGREESFQRLVENNALNLQYKYNAIVLNPSDAADQTRQRIDQMLKEVHEL